MEDVELVRAELAGQADRDLGVEPPVEQPARGRDRRPGSARTSSGSPGPASRRARARRRSGRTSARACRSGSSAPRSPPRTRVLGTRAAAAIAAQSSTCGQRRLAVDVLPGRQRGFDDRAVQVGRRGDDHRLRRARRSSSSPMVLDALGPGARPSAGAQAPRDRCRRSPTTFDGLDLLELAEDRAALPTRADHGQRAAALRRLRRGRRGSSGISATAASAAPLCEEGTAVECESWVCRCR